MRKANALHIHMHARDTQHRGWVFTGGWEDFFTDALQVRWTIGSSPLNALPHSTFLPLTPVCTAFGASSWTPQHLLNHARHTQTAILLRTDCLTPKEHTEWFDLLDNIFSNPRMAHPLRIFVLTNRRNCRLTNAWLEAHEMEGRCHMIASMKHMNCKCMKGDGAQKWVRDPGPWNLCIIEHSCTQWQNLDTKKIARTLHRLTHSTPYPGAQQHIPEAFRHTASAKACNRSLEQFWHERDKAAEERGQLLKPHRVNWTAVDEKLQHTSRLLIDCPCPQLARVARLPLGDH